LTTQNIVVNNIREAIYGKEPYSNSHLSGADHMRRDANLSEAQACAGNALCDAELLLETDSSYVYIRFDLGC
jgi:hypothetical protein